MFKNSNNGYLIAILIAVLTFSLLTVYASSSVERSLGVSARGAALYQPDTKKLLFGKNSSQRLSMASTTKIMTALVALENANDLEVLVPIDESAIGTEGSSAYLRSGDVLTMRELLYALLLQSANDAAVAIACFVGGDESGFVDMMNEKAAELGLSDTHFSNPHGLDAPEHYTTARDLAVLGAEALKNEELLAIASTYKKTIVTGERRRTYVNHNKLLYKYDGAIGLKTGFTDESGRCLVGAAERDGVRLISVTLDAPNDWCDHELMLDWGFEKTQRLTLAATYEYSFDLPKVDGTGTVRVTNCDELSAVVEREEREVKDNVVLPRFISKNYKKGDVIGKVCFTAGGEELGSVDLIVTEDVRLRDDRGFWQKMIDKITGK